MSKRSEFPVLGLKSLLLTTLLTAANLAWAQDDPVPRSADIVLEFRNSPLSKTIDLVPDLPGMYSRDFYLEDGVPFTELDGFCYLSSIRNPEYIRLLIMNGRPVQLGDVEVRGMSVLLAVKPFIPDQKPWVNITCVKH